MGTESRHPVMHCVVSDSSNIYRESNYHYAYEHCVESQLFFLFFFPLESLTQHETLKDTASLAAAMLESCDSDQLFNAEEALGRRVNMNSLFLRFTNLTKYRKQRIAEFTQSELSRLKKKQAEAKKVKKEFITDEEIQTHLDELKFVEIDYIKYLRIFDEFNAIPRYCKYKEKEYDFYLTDLLDYLKGVLNRIHPLSNHERVSELKFSITTTYIDHCAIYFFAL